ncbi:head GIN domain-containing protein [Hymenobacter ruricola]|uniref:DUF2807 domain-containing protein n=1 Tax=Hymenobacter ruricola TaxID=2791023 RepID=A0ABS0I7H8_9BACT|nr:head GIN domain-containing protein [Hymenobacter ruricola]MBF9222643.1 DUF2807 domain-containing protein [Hymenobacter ruricola]
MKPLFPFRSAVFAAATVFCSCSVQAQVKQPRQLGTFEAVASSGGIDVVLTQGSNTSVVVEASDEAQAHLVTKVEGGTLKIGWENGFSWKNLLSNNRKANVYITCPRLTALSLSGGADAKGQSTFSADAFKISASGGSDVKLSLTAKTLTCSASGGSDLSLSGRVEQQTVDVSGGSDYHAFDLQSSRATVRASGGSDVNLSVDGELTANAGGGSDVRYKGNARVANATHSGGSSVRRAN